MKLRAFTVVIDEDAPLPAKRSTARSREVHPLSYLLDKLKPGESFIYPASTCERFNGLRSLSYSLGKLWGRRFATRAVIDRDGVERLRFWRTK